MLILLSPAKSLNEGIGTNHDFTQPRLMTQSWRLIKTLKKFKPKELSDLMDISDNLAKENVKRNKSFKRTHTLENSKTAIETFDGDVYKGLSAVDFDEKDMDFAQKHIRILSGLYGVLRPLDLMQEYRLEMGTSLKTDLGTNLYQFWDDKVTKLINKDLKESGTDLIVNLASNEYFKVIQKKKIKGNILNINFKEYHNGTLKFISFNAKKARGLMSRYIVKNQLTSIEEMKGFNTDNYHFDEKESTDYDWLFVR
jgi:uncharacterized protein